MKLQKSFMACLLAGCIVVGLTACGGSDGTKSKEDKAPKEEKISLEYTNKEPVSLWDNEENMAFYDETITNQAVTAMIPYVAEETSGSGCVIICPGGGYQHHALDKEGIAIAEALNENGITAFVLEYRIKPYTYEAILSDISRAVRFVRYYAREFKIDPEKIAVMGFSAGGHLAAMKVVHNDIDTQNKDAIDKVSDEVDCGLLSYPVITMMDPYAHKGSRENFLGEKVDNEELRKKYSAELQVDSNTPPCFIWHCRTDGTVRIQNTEMYIDAMSGAGVEVESRFYTWGGHGLGLAENEGEAKQWFPDAVAWLKKRGY